MTSDYETKYRAEIKEIHDRLKKIVEELKHKQRTAVSTYSDMTISEALYFIKTGVSYIESLCD